MDGAVAVEKTEPKEVVLSCGYPSYQSRDGPSPDVLIVRRRVEGSAIETPTIVQDFHGQRCGSREDGAERISSKLRASKLSE